MWSKLGAKHVWNNIFKKVFLIFKSQSAFLFLPILNWWRTTKAFQFYSGRKLYTAWNKKFIPSEDEMSLLKHFLKSNDVVFDVGANIGEFSYFLSTIIKEGMIYSFEPQKRVFNVLRGSSKKIKNAHLYNLALSSYTGNSTLYIPTIKGRLSPSEASLDQHFNDFTGYKKIKKCDKYANETINLMTLDYFCEKSKINRIDFIKCDTEGHELEVLKGSEKCLRKFRPILLIEVFPYVYEGHFEEVGNYLNEFNYIGYVISENKNDVCELNEKTLKNSKGFNYFFIPKEKEKVFLNCFSAKLLDKSKNESI